MNILPYISIIILIGFSAFFSGTEIAYTSVNKLRLKKLAEEGSKTAALASDISDKFDKMLSSILIGNNLVNIAASSVGAVIAMHLIGGAKGTAVATLVMTVLILIFGEIVPKILAKKHAQNVTLIVAYPLKVLMLILSPAAAVVVAIVKLLSRLWKKDESAPTVTEEELVTIIETVEEEGVIDEHKSELLQSAIEFNDISLNDILTPRTEMVSIDIDDDMDSIIHTATESHYSRIPVYEDNIDNIIGVLYLNRLYKVLADNMDVDIRSLLMEPCFFHKTMKLPAVLNEMRRRQVHLAVVIDEYGGTMGIVTMEDILEEIVGDIWDETDEIKNDYVKVGENTYDVCGDMSVYDFFEQLDVDDRDFESEYTTVGGWAIEMLQCEPHEGDSYHYKNLYIIVSEMDDMRVTKLTVMFKPVEEEEYE